MNIYVLRGYDPSKEMCFYLHKNRNGIIKMVYDFMKATLYINENVSRFDLYNYLIYINKKRSSIKPYRVRTSKLNTKEKIKVSRFIHNAEQI